MAKAKKNEAQGAAANEAAMRAFAKANVEILELYQKLGARLRSRAKKALARSEAADSVRKRVARRKAFEIYGDAATEVEQRVAEMRARIEASPTHEGDDASRSTH